MYMGKLDVKSKQNPRLLQKTLADGRKSLYLEYYYQHRRYYDEEFVDTLSNTIAAKSF